MAAHEHGDVAARSAPSPCPISPRRAASSSRAISAAQARVARRFASPLAGGPSSVVGNCQSCSADRVCVRSIKGLRFFCPNATGSYASPSSMKAHGFAPNTAFSAPISGSLERWFSASE